MVNCSNCKHWKFPLGSYVFNQKYEATVGECKAVLHDDGSIRHHDLNGDPDENYDEDTFNIPLASVVDGSGYFAAMRTRGDFYCCLHERKENE